MSIVFRRSILFLVLLISFMAFSFSYANADTFDAPSSFSVKEGVEYELLEIRYNGNDKLSDYKVISQNESIAKIYFTIFENDVIQLAVQPIKKGSTQFSIVGPNSNKEVFSITINVVGKEEKAADNSEPIQFESILLKSFASQIKEASDLTLTENNRAILAAAMTLEYQVQEPDSKVDLTTPIYAARSGTMASVSFNTDKGYVLIIFQMNPLTTYYGFANSSDPQMAYGALLMSSDEVWEVPFDLFYEKLKLLVDQIT